MPDAASRLAQAQVPDAASRLARAQVPDVASRLAQAQVPDAASRLAPDAANTLGLASQERLARLGGKRVAEPRGDKRYRQRAFLLAAVRVQQPELEVVAQAAAQRVGPEILREQA